MSVNFQGTRVLVTGAGGQLGGYLRQALSGTGAELIGTGSTAREGVDLVMDITDRDAVRATFDRIGPGIVIHAAAFTDVDGAERTPEQAMAVNGAGAEHVAAAANDTGAFLLAVGTDFVFAGDGGAPFVEDATTRPVSVYGASKLAGEEAILAANPDFAVARTAWLYGGSGKHFPRTVLTVIRDRGGIDVVDDEFGSPTFAGDLALALVLLATRRAPGIFHLANAGRTSRFELARSVAGHAGLDPEQVRPISTPDFLAKFPLPAKRPGDSTLRNVRAAALGVTLPDWNDAAARYTPRLAAELGLSSSNA